MHLGRQKTGWGSSGDPTPYLRAANVRADGFDLADVQEMPLTEEERRRYLLRPGDLLIAESSGSAAQVGRAAVWDGEIPGCCFQNTLIRFRPHAALPAYALAVFRYLQLSGYFSRSARGVGIQHIGLARLASAPFPLPPLAEQERIAEELDRRLRHLAVAEAALTSALQRGVEARREILAVVVESAREAASDVPRTEAEAQPRAALHDSIGAGSTTPTWGVTTVAQAGTLQLGRALTPEDEYGGEDTPYLRAANIGVDGLDLSTVLTMPMSPEEQATYALEPGDVLLAEASGSAAQVGRSAVWQDEIPDCCFQNTLVRFRPHPSVAPEYANLIFGHLRASGAFARAARGVGIQHLGASRLAGLPFPLPPHAAQREIVADAHRLSQEARGGGARGRGRRARVPQRGRKPPG